MSARPAVPGSGRSDRWALRRLASATLSLAVIGIASVPALAAGDVLNGLALARLMCTGCHVVGWSGAGAFRGPQLPQLVNRLALGPDALRAWLSSAHPPMPNFSLDLTSQQIDDIAAYLDSLRVR